jgi:hypothetical protein
MGNLSAASYDVGFGFGFVSFQASVGQHNLAAAAIVTASLEQAIAVAEEDALR